jgi:hypothetical protein
MTDTKKDDPIAFVREIVSSAFWSAAYHDRELPLAVKRVAFLREMLRRAGIDEKNIDRGEEDEDGEAFCETVEQYARYILDLALGSVEHHERQIQNEHNNLALMKIMLARGGYTDAEINIAEIETEQRKRAQK